LYSSTVPHHMSALAVCPLHDLGLLHFRGSDAGKFLQGQLSNDLSSLHPGVLLRAGLHNPQGRTLALLALSAGAAADELSAILPRELLASVAATLSRYVLRAKVRIVDDAGQHQVYGLDASSRAAGQAGGAADGADSAAAASIEQLAPVVDGSELLRGYDPRRALFIARADQGGPGGTALTRSQWRALDIAAGLPQVYGATAGQFVAQMLNLDCIDAVSFTKGCYTGQEVIARAHYRGRVKRRMQRFLSDAPLRLAPGDEGLLADGRGFRVVDAIEHPDGRCEFLAVAPVSHAAEAGSGAEVAAMTAGGDRQRIAARALALPYPLPD
jgi:folate-binding protein YgfZ